MDRIKSAEMFARGAHIGQKHGERPYYAHPRDVVDVLEGLGYDTENLVCAAWLHDTIEDTPTTYQDLKQLFGVEVAELVWAVTDELGRNRKERKARTYPKIFASFESTILKLADTAANVEAALAGEQKILQMYLKEWTEIYNAFMEALNGFTDEDAQSALACLMELDKRVKERRTTDVS